MLLAVSELQGRHGRARDARCRKAREACCQGGRDENQEVKSTHITPLDSSGSCFCLLALLLLAKRRSLPADVFLPNSLTLSIDQLTGNNGM